MKIRKYLFVLLLMFLSVSNSMMAQQRRPIDSQHPLWFIHVDVWYQADPQKIIDLIPEEIRPYVCLNLSIVVRIMTKIQVCIRSLKMHSRPISLGARFASKTVCGSHASRHRVVIRIFQIMTS